MRQEWLKGLAVAWLTVGVLEGSACVANDRGEESLPAGASREFQEGESPKKAKGPDEELPVCSRCLEIYVKEAVAHALQAHFECTSCGERKQTKDGHSYKAVLCGPCARKAGACAMCGEKKAPKSERAPLPACDKCSKQWSQFEIGHAESTHLDCVRCGAKAKEMCVKEHKDDTYPRAVLCRKCAEDLGKCTLCAQAANVEKREPVSDATRKFCETCSKKWPDELLRHAFCRFTCFSCDDARRSMHDCPRGAPVATLCEQCALKQEKCTICSRLLAKSSDEDARKDAGACPVCWGKVKGHEITLRHYLKGHFTCSDCKAAPDGECNCSVKLRPTLCKSCAKKAGRCGFCGQDMDK